MPHDPGTSAERVTADDTLHVQGLERMPGREVGAPGARRVPHSAEPARPPDLH